MMPWLGNQMLTFQGSVVSSSLRVEIPNKIVLRCLDMAAKISNNCKLSSNLLNVRKMFYNSSVGSG
jgi:hypothetical protein